MLFHFNKLISLFREAEMGADIVCGPEDMQHIGQLGSILTFLILLPENSV
jgi:hypothetical protein